MQYMYFIVSVATNDQASSGGQRSVSPGQQSGSIAGRHGTVKKNINRLGKIMCCVSPSLLLHYYYYIIYIIFLDSLHLLKLVPKDSFWVALLQGEPSDQMRPSKLL